MSGITENITKACPRILESGCGIIPILFWLALLGYSVDLDEKLKNEYDIDNKTILNNTNKVFL